MKTADRNVSYLFGCLLFVGLAVLPCTHAVAESWVMSVQNEDLSPFKHRNGFAPGGINVDIMAAIAHEIGVDLEYADYSIAEGRERFRSGEITVDCCLNAIWFPHDDAIQVFSKPIYRLIEVFVFPKDKVFKVPDTTVLTDKTVVGIRGFTYPSEENFGKRIDRDSPLEVLKVLNEGKADVGVLERHAASFYMSHNELEVEFGDPYYSVEVSVRLHKSMAHRLADINEAIDKLKEKGMISQIISRNIR